MLHVLGPLYPWKSKTRGVDLISLPVLEGLSQKCRGISFGRSYVGTKWSSVKLAFALGNEGSEDPNPICRILEMFLVNGMELEYVFVVCEDSHVEKLHFIMTLEDAVEQLDPANLVALRGYSPKGKGKAAIDPLIPSRLIASLGLEVEDLPRFRDMKVKPKKWRVEEAFRGNRQLLFDYGGLVVLDLL